TPIKPRPIQDSALTLALALGCAVVAAFVRDYLDGSVRQPSDVRRLGLPLLGVIAEGRRVADRKSQGRRLKGSPLLILNGQRQQPFTEGYRALRAALGRVERGAEQGEVLLVTSTLPGEGKSLTAVNLALTLASADERVLLVDCDLRRPA